MPGIVGLVTKAPRQEAEQQLEAMLNAIRHDPSYMSGTFMDAALGVYIGWTARRGSFCDKMPLQNGAGDVFLVFAGEEFSDRANDGRFKARGQAVTTHGPSYLIQRYEDDPQFPAGLNGRFHGFLLDRARRTALLFNDRYGMHRIYYHESKEAFYFAAEAKAILKVRPELRTPDLRGMGEFVSCGCVLENRTLFKGIQVLPPGSVWTFQNSTVGTQNTYFHGREWEEQEPLQTESYYLELRQVFERALPRYFAGHERIGMSLTGGLDTRMIMAWQKCPAGSLPCYSFGSMFRDCQDVVLARRVAQACGQDHAVIPVGRDFLANFPRYAERSVYLTDGCVDVSHSADLYVNEEIAKIAPVRMTGNYGGEVLRRVRAFKPVHPASGLFNPEFVKHINRADATYEHLIQGHPLSFAVFRQAPWHHYGLLSLEQTQVSLRSPFLDNDFVRTVFRAPQSACTNDNVSRRLIADGNTSLTGIRTDRGPISGLNGWRAGTVRNLISFTIKAEYAYDYGMPQWMAGVDHVLSPLHLERLFLGRNKFYHYRIWYRDTLSTYVESMLLDPRTLSRPYLESATVRKMVRQHVRGERNYTSEIHKLLTLELISRTLLDSQ